MNRYEKAVASLADRDIYAYVNRESVYVDIDGVELEISSAEIEFQAELYDQNNVK